MGHVFVNVTLSNPTNPELKSTVEAMVDTGATVTVVPRSIAAALHLPVLGTRAVRTATGEIRLDTGGVVIQINGDSAMNPILISDTVDRTLVGVITLETLGLTVDPTTGALKEAELYLYLGHTRGGFP
jgi:clan AA aspartic protease